MKSGWRVGSIFGIPLYLDPSWFFIVAFFTYLYGTAWLATPWGASGAAWIAGLIMSLALFVSVLLHELGHSLVARSQGITVNSITLFLFGGIASIDEESKTPLQAFQVAIAGPAVSFTLFILLTLSMALPLLAPVKAILGQLAGLNLVLTLFNMIPGLPLDGGQVLKAAIWKATGSHTKGVRWSARIGQMLGWMAIFVGIGACFTPLGLQFLWLALLGWFGIRNASAYSSITDLQEALTQIKAESAMSREFRVVDAHMKLRKFADQYLQDSSDAINYYASSEGRYRGLVAPEDLNTIERSLWDSQTLQDIIHPLDTIPSVSVAAPLSEVVDRLEVKELRRITVCSPAGAVAGVIDRADVVRALAEKLNIPIPSLILQRIKEEGQYPPGLQLHAIAKSAPKN
jgi:Zn-dependent protease/CBS domain-containing protein